jgi:hypothetical protein
MLRTVSLQPVYRGLRFIVAATLLWKQYVVVHPWLVGCFYLLPW